MPQTFKNQAKPIYCSQFLWFPHMYTRCENRTTKGPKIETKTTPNPLNNDTNFEPKKQCNKKRHKNELETTMCRKIVEKGPKKDAQKQRDKLFKTFFSPLVVHGFKMVASGSKNGADGGKICANGGQNYLMLHQI